MLGIESVLDPDRDILDTDRVYRRGIDDLRTEVTKLHRLDIRKLIDGIGSLDDFRVGSHETVHIRPYLQTFRIQYSGYDRGGIV